MIKYWRPQIVNWAGHRTSSCFLSGFHQVLLHTSTDALSFGGFCDE